MTDKQYEVAVGVRCPDCLMLLNNRIHLVSAVCECKGFAPEQNRNE